MPSSQSPSAQLSRALLKGNFALAEKKWAAGARWGEPNEPNEKGTRRKHKRGEDLGNGLVWFEHHDLWFHHGRQQSGTATWDFLDNHEAPLFGHPPTPATRAQLLRSVLSVGRLDLAEWLHVRGLPENVIAPVPSLWYPPPGTVHSTRAQTWNWVLDHYPKINTAPSTDSDKVESVFEQALELALEDEAFLPVIDRLLGLGADVTTVAPAQKKTFNIPIPSALATVRETGGTALHVLVGLAIHEGLAISVSSWQLRLRMFPALWNRLVAAGADPAMPNGEGQVARDLLSGTGPLQDHLRAIEDAQQREARAVGLSITPVIRPRRRRQN